VLSALRSGHTSSISVLSACPLDQAADWPCVCRRRSCCHRSRTAAK
jgi:hypothetical protein